MRKRRKMRVVGLVSPSSAFANLVTPCSDSRISPPIENPVRSPLATAASSAGSDGSQPISIPVLSDSMPSAVLPRVIMNTIGTLPT